MQNVRYSVHSEVCSAPCEESAVKVLESGQCSFLQKPGPTTHRGKQNLFCGGSVYARILVDDSLTYEVKSDKFEENSMAVTCIIVTKYSGTLFGDFWTQLVASRIPFLWSTGQKQARK